MQDIFVLDSLKWGFSELSKLAAKHGGPEMLLAIIKDFSFNEGVRKGKVKMIPWLFAALGAGVLIRDAIPKVPSFICRCRSKFKKQNLTPEEAKAAEEILTHLMKEEMTDIEKYSLEEDESETKNDE